MSSIHSTVLPGQRAELAFSLPFRDTSLHFATKDSTPLMSRTSQVFGGIGPALMAAPSAGWSPPNSPERLMDRPTTSGVSAAVQSSARVRARLTATTVESVTVLSQSRAGRWATVGGPRLPLRPASRRGCGRSDDRSGAPERVRVIRCGVLAVAVAPPGDLVPSSSDSNIGSIVRWVDTATVPSPTPPVRLLIAPNESNAAARTRPETDRSTCRRHDPRRSRPLRISLIGNEVEQLGPSSPPDPTIDELCTADVEQSRSRVC